MTTELNILGENNKHLKSTIYWRAIDFQEALYKSYTYNRNNIHYQIFLLNDLQNLLRIALDSDKYDNDIDQLIMLFHAIEISYLDTNIERH